MSGFFSLIDGWPKTPRRDRDAVSDVDAFKCGGGKAVGLTTKQLSLIARLLRRATSS
jgi:hypothetical protein